jgi:hypothetical protein
MEPRIPTVEKTPPEQQTVLLHVEELKQPCLDEHVEYTFKEFRLQGGTESLKAFVDFCFLEDGKYDRHRIVWIAENVFVRLGGYIALPRVYYRNRRFGFRLSTSDSSPDHDLSIHSSTTEEAIAALDLLAGLQDYYFKKMELQEYGARTGNRLHVVCPLSGRHLENFVSNANRENRFSRMMFTRDQCRTLATSGIRTNIGFRDCRFEDGGIAFVEASAARENQEWGPAKLSIWGILPFNEANFRLFLSQHNLESLMLYNIHLRNEESCRALAAADLQKLELRSCTLSDGGEALVDFVRDGRGPRALCLGFYQFDSAERFLSFINALRGNTYLERLDLSDIYYSLGSPQALTRALLENKGLVHFGLYQSRLDAHCWSELMAAISTHPTLRSLSFREGGAPDEDKKRARTKSVADMLLVNKRVDRIHFDSDTFNRDDWNAFVSPVLDCNLYRDWIVGIEKIQDPSTRAAVVARALARVESKPSLVWMVLSNNHDVVCSYLDEALVDSVSLSSPKRRWAPSDDDQGDRD